MAVKFSGDACFEDIVSAAGVEMDPRGLYFAKPHRNCQSQAAFNGAVRMALAAKDKEIMRLMDDLAKASDRTSKEASRAAALAEQNAKITRTAIGRGLEALPDISPVTRDRLLNVNAG